MSPKPQKQTSTAQVKNLKKVNNARKIKRGSSLSSSIFSFNSFLPSVLALTVAIVAFYVTQQGSSHLDNEVTPLPVQNEVPEKNYRSHKRQKYDEFGMVIGRPLPVVNLMPESKRAEFEVLNPEDFEYVDFLPGPPMQQRKERAMGARFKNFYNFSVTKYWDDGSETGVYSGTVPQKGNTATNTYTTHSFIFRKADTGEVLEKITMQDNRHLYFIGPAKDDKDTVNSPMYQNALAELEHMEEYYSQHGTPWLSHYPRDPPQLFLYPADFVGQKHFIRSYIGYHKSLTEQHPEPVDFNITVLSTSPRVLLIENLLNDYEIEHIIKMGEKVVKRSKVGSASNGFTSSTRTSENGWLKRSQSKVLNKVYYRFADVLRMSDAQLKDDGSGSAENLQFVRYLESQRYDPHHDFGYTGKAEQRFSTLLIYLEIPEEGGGTSFPKAFNGQGIKVKPSKGDAVLFYSMLPDGNGDDMSLHAGMPVIKGRKYVCNLWSWDPHV